MKRNKKIFTAVLIFLILVLGGVSIYISLRLQQSTAPTTGSANSIACTDNSQCPSDQFCMTAGNYNQCIIKLSDGVTCSDNSWCQSGICSNGKCAKLANGESCNENRNCQSNFCDSSKKCAPTGPSSAACHTDPNDSSSTCKKVTSWANGVAPDVQAEASKPENLGKQCMAVCNSDGTQGVTCYSNGTPPTECQCPALNPGAGQCAAGTCAHCGNPTVKCDKAYTGGSGGGSGYGCHACTGCDPAKPNSSDECYKNLDNSCVKMGYCASGTPNVSQGGIAYCQDGNGPIYPISGIQVFIAPADNQSNNKSATTDANGRFFIDALQYYPAVEFMAGVSYANYSAINPLSAYTGKTLSNGQPLSALKAGDTNNSIFENCNLSGGWTRLNTTANYFCNNNPPATNATRYQFYIPNYSYGQSYIKYRFSNCSPTPVNLNVSAVPNCSATNQSIANISWTASPNATAYAVDISESSTFTSGQFWTSGSLPSSQTNITAPSGFTRNGSPLLLDPNKTYYARVFYSGLNQYSNVQSFTTKTCTSASEPLMTVIKQNTSTCESNGDQLLNYTITATNIGDVSGSVTSIEDVYDPNLTSNSITPTNINNGGSNSNGKITWAGSSFTSKQAQNYTYQIRIPKNLLGTFISLGGIKNKVTVMYNTSTSTSSADFELTSNIVCAAGIIPVTGILDDARYLLIGMILITLSFVAYRFRIGTYYLETLLYPELRMQRAKTKKQNKFRKEIKHFKKEGEKFLERIVEKDK